MEDNHVIHDHTTPKINSPAICRCLIREGKCIHMQRGRPMTSGRTGLTHHFSCLPLQIPPRTCEAWGWCGNPWTRWGVWGSAPPFPSSASSSPSSSSSTSTLKTATCWLVRLCYQSATILRPLPREVNVMVITLQVSGLLGNAESWDSLTTNRNVIEDRTQPFMALLHPTEGQNQQVYEPHQTTDTHQRRRLWPGHQTPQITVQSSSHGMQQNHTWNRGQVPQESLRGPWSRPLLVTKAVMDGWFVGDGGSQLSAWNLALIWQITVVVFLWFAKFELWSSKPVICKLFEFL